MNWVGIIIFLIGVCAGVAGTFCVANDFGFIFVKKRVIAESVVISFQEGRDMAFDSTSVDEDYRGYISFCNSSSYHRLKKLVGDI